jgi:dolichyl-phosphate beta-glucosyltransferase
MELSIIVPCRNEEHRLPATLQRLRTFRSETPSTELILVDDGSTDGTRMLMEGELRQSASVKVVVLPVNRGKGRAVAAGVAVSTGRQVLISDADLSTPIEELSALQGALGAGADVAIGVRTGRGARAGQPLQRRIMGSGFRLLTQTLLLPGIEDSQCGFKLLQGDLARRVFAALTTDGFAFDVEILRRARQSGARVVQVPVRWHDAPGSTVSPMRHSLQMLRDLLRLRLTPNPRAAHRVPSDSGIVPDAA